MIHAVKLTTCGGTISQLVQYIQSPNYPGAAPAGMCMYTINKCDSGICQFKYVCHYSKAISGEKVPSSYVIAA